MRFFLKFLVAALAFASVHGVGRAEGLLGSPEQTGSLGSATPASETHQFVVAIDAGHGGMDPGAVSHDGLREKDVVLAFATALQGALEKTGHFHVVMTRADDHFLKLEDRAKIAREAKADLFIAIHADTLDDASVRGTTIYTLSEKASDATAEALAQKENRADAIAGMDLGGQKEDVANALIALAQRESKAQSMLFARKAVGEISAFTELTSKPIRSAAFVVLKSPDVPSVLVELGYLSNKKDKAMLASPGWRSDLAKALAKAVDAHFTPTLTVQK